MSLAKFTLSSGGLVLLAGACTAASVNLDWLPVTPVEMEMKASRVEKDAGAEALFWRVHVLDEAQGQYPHTVMFHYVRIKIFNDRGKDQEGTIHIPYTGKTSIIGVAGRTIKPDGSIVELQKDAIFDRELVRGGGVRIKAKSFAMPAVEPGCIVEYRWRENHEGQLANYVGLQFQREIPVQIVKYYIKPLTHPYFPYAMRSIAFQARVNPFVQEPDGFVSTLLENVPAYKAEPRMPPDNQVRPWMLIYYAPDKKLTPEKFWIDYGKEVYNKAKPLLKVNDDVKKAAESAIEGATDPEEKLARLIRYCRTQIKNSRNDDVTEQQRAKVKQDQSPGDTLKRGMGTGVEVNMLFAAMATAAGFEAHYAKLSNRGEVFFDKTFPDGYFLRSYDIAVKLNDQWRFYDVNVDYLPAGMLRWQEEGVEALIADPKNPVFVTTPMSLPNKSQRARSARFTLKEDGSIEGEVTLQFTGHVAAGRRQTSSRESAEKRVEDFLKAVKGQYTTASVSDIKIENLDDAEKPLKYFYHVKIEGYAQRTGKRLFVQPSFFQLGQPAMFPTSERRNPIYFQYPYREDDTVTIQMPPGFELDHPDAPAPLNFGKPGSYAVSISVDQDRKLIYRRSLIFGKDGAIFFPVAVYPTLKGVFDSIHERDNHTLTLKQAGA